MGKLFLWWVLACAMACAAALGSTEFFDEALPVDCADLVSGANFEITGFESVSVSEEPSGTYGIYFIKSSTTFFLVARYTPNAERGGYDIITYHESIKLPAWSANPPISAEAIRQRNQRNRQLNDTDILSSLQEVKESDLLPSLRQLFGLTDEAIESRFEELSDRLQVFDMVNEWELGASILASESKQAEAVARLGFIALGENAQSKDQRRRLLLETPTKQLKFDESNEDLKNLKTLIRAYHLMSQYYYKEEAMRSVDRILNAIP